MFGTIALFLIILLVQVAQYSGHLHGTTAGAITIGLFLLMSVLHNRGRRRQEEGHVVAHRSQLFGYTRQAQIFSPAVQKYFVWSMMLFVLGISWLLLRPGEKIELDLVNQEKLQQRTQRQTEEREAFEEHNRNASKAFKESRDIQDPTARKAKLEEALKEAEAALQQADGFNRTQLLEMKTTLQFDLEQFEEADKSFGEYVESGGDKVDFPRALYDREMYQQSLSSLQKLLAKKKPCEAGILELQLLFKLDQGVEASNRFFDLKGCRNKPHYDELKVQYEKFQSDRQ